jgi:hypothetical protein
MAARAELAGLLEQFASEIVATGSITAKAPCKPLQEHLALRRWQHPNRLFDFREGAHGFDGNTVVATRNKTRSFPEVVTEDELSK